MNGHTGAMRIYLPATPAELVARRGLGARDVHGVTPALRAALPEEDDEGWEFSAQLAAADASLALLAAPGAGRRRLVVSVDVPDAAVVPVPDGRPTSLRLDAPVIWLDVVCVHVDGAEARADIAAALHGDADAAARLGERDLLWYDVTELDALAEELRAEADQDD